MIYVPGVPALCLRDTPVRCMVVWSPLSCAERPVTAERPRTPLTAVRAPNYKYSNTGPASASFHYHGCMAFFALTVVVVRPESVGGVGLEVGL